jgi:hypothetical protein
MGPSQAKRDLIQVRRWQQVGTTVICMTESLFLVESQAVFKSFGVKYLHPAQMSSTERGLDEE